MILTQQEIDKARIPWNYCLIKLPQSYSVMLHNHYEHQLGNTKIVIDTSFDPATHAPRWGMIVKNPENLLYKKLERESCGWETTIETVEGDLVYFDYWSCLQALGKLANPSLPGESPKWFKVGDDLYVLIRYDALVMTVRDDKVICLNGNVVLRPYIVEKKSDLILPAHMKHKEEKLIGEVLYVGKHNTAYLDGCRDANDIQVGDICVIKNYKLRLENMLANQFEKNLFFVQLKHIWMVLNR